MVRTAMAMAGALALAGAAQGSIVGFTETFDDGPANWHNFNGSEVLEWFADGGPDGGPYASSVYNLQNFSGGFPPIVIRAQQSFNSSDNAFVGDWIDAGVTGVAFDIRHDLPEAVRITGRFATPANNPGAATETADVIPADTWTRVEWDLTEDSPDIISFGSGNYQSIFSDIGNIQLGAEIPGSLAGENIDARFDIDNFTIIPAPGTAALLGLGGVLALRRRR